jgi:hypothetical protein
LVKNKHPSESIRHGLLNLLQTMHIDEANIVAKGLMKSVTEHNTPEEQIEFFYFLDKACLLP